MEIKHYNKTNWDQFPCITQDHIVRVEDSIVIVYNHNYDFINLNTKNISAYHNLKYPYKKINPFINGYSIVTNNDDTNSLISIDKKVIMTYSHIDYLFDNLYLVNYNNRYGVYNNQGKEIIPILYSEIIPNDKLFYVSSGGLKGVINRHGNVIVPVIYKDISYMKDNKFIVTWEDYLSEENQKNKNEELKGLYDINTKKLIKPKYSEMKFTNDNNLIVRDKNKYFKINYDGNILKKLKLNRYKKIKVLNNGMLLGSDRKGIIIDTNDYLLDCNGNVIMAKSVILKGPSNNVLNIYSEKEGCMYDYLINSAGQIVSKPYTSISQISDNYYRTFIRISNTHLQNGIIDKTGKEIISNLYRSIYILSNDLIVAVDEYYNLFNSKGHLIASYKFISALNYGYAVFYDNTRSGLIDEEGDEIYDSYDHITSFIRKENLLLIYYQDHVDLINTNGTIILENVRETIHILNDNQLIINNSIVNIQDIKIEPVYYVEELYKYYSSYSEAQKEIEKAYQKKKVK